MARVCKYDLSHRGIPIDILATRTLFAKRKGREQQQRREAHGCRQRKRHQNGQNRAELLEVHTEKARFLEQLEELT